MSLREGWYLSSSNAEKKVISSHLNTSGFENKYYFYKSQNQELNI